ncbi:hypothetical protein E4511_24220 [Escherichia coli]|nr:hypothetical protein [Escherichia coli]
MSLYFQTTVIPKTSIICSPVTNLKTSIKTITYLSDISCMKTQESQPTPYKYYSLALLLICS